MMADNTKFHILGYLSLFFCGFIYLLPGLLMYLVAVDD